MIEQACGPTPGKLTLHINSQNPTVTTASTDFVRAADGAGGWEGQVWDRAIEVSVTTVDKLIEAYGMPQFVKIDVEGFEDDVLAGLTQRVPALSFEFTTIQRDVALKCLNRLAALGPYHFDVALGESQIMTFGKRRRAQDHGRAYRGTAAQCQFGRRLCGARTLKAFVAAYCCRRIVLLAWRRSMPNPVAVEVTNASEPVLCAEKDNVTLAFASPLVKTFRIEAAHPAYIGALQRDSFEADWTACDMKADPVFKSGLP